MKTGPLQTTCIGHVASAALFKRQSFQVTGTTSRGVYLQPDGEVTIFLSSESFRGPLTLNIDGDADNFPAFQTGDILAKVDDQLISKTDNLSINIRSPQYWKPSKPPVYKKLSRHRSFRIFRQARSILGEHPYLSLLEFASGGSPALLEAHPDLADRVTSLVTSVRKGEPDDLLSGMLLNLGAGPGLTPLGDDLLLGVLLTIKRSGKINFKIREEGKLYLALLEKAQEKTTTLSWSLLYCAALGSADERIIRVADRLIAGRKITNQDLTNLLEWGSSSGIGVLAGMMAVLAQT